MDAIDIIDHLDGPLEALDARQIVNAMVKWFAGVAEQLVKRLLGGGRDAEALLHAEEELFQATSRLGALIVGGALVALHADRTWVRESCHASEASLPEPYLQRHAGNRETVVHLLGGLSIRLKTPYYVVKPRVRVGRRRRVGRRGRSGAGKGRYPVLERLGTRDQMTPALASDIARHAVRLASFEEAQEALAERGCPLDRKTVRRITLSVGEAALQQRMERVEAARRGEVYSDEFVGKRIVLGTDGGRLRTREGGKRGRRNKKGRRRYRTPWREPKIVTAYTVDDEGRQSRKAAPLYDGTLGNADAAFELLAAELKLRGAAKADLIVLTGDGAVWIWNRADDLARALGIPRSRIIKVVDFYHAVENLTAVANERAWTVAQRKDWVRRQRRRLHRGKIGRVIADIAALCRGRNARKIGVHLRYFEDRREYMRYAQFRKQGIPCGSGATESAVRRVVNLRLKGPGIFWEPANAERMLHLRAYLKAGRWRELMLRVIYRSPDGRPLHTVEEGCRDAA